MVFRDKARDGTTRLTGAPARRGVVEEVLPGTNVEVDNADPAYPRVSAFFTETPESLPVTLYDAKGDILIGSADNSAGRLVVGADGTVLTADSSLPLGVKWALASGAGVILLDYGNSVPVGTPVGTIVFEKKQPVTILTWDFRGLSALPAGWNRRIVASETFSAAGMAATYSGGAAHYYGLSTLVPAGTFETKMTLGPTASVFVGAQVFNNISLLGANVHWYNGPSGCLVTDMSGSGHAYSSSTFANAGGSPGVPAWFRNRYDGAGKAYASYSMNGSTWSSEAFITWAIGAGVNEVALGSSLGSGSATWEYAKWSPTSAGLGGLKGWWDGTSVVSFT